MDSLFNKVAGFKALSAANLLKKDSNTGVSLQNLRT